MPQLLYFLNLNETAGTETLDFGTLLVYTCEQSCPTDSHYVTEFLWRQLIE
jgi:hypothetical protein